MAGFVSNESFACYHGNRMACQKKPQKNEEGEREKARGNTNTEREREKHLTVNRVREELAFIFPSRRNFFSVELNKCWPFPLRLSPPLEDNPGIGAVCRHSPSHSSRLCLVTVCCLLFACIPHPGRVTWAHVLSRGFTGSLLAAAGRSLSPPHRSHQSALRK